METFVHFVSNPFINTTKEEEGWRLINTIQDISCWNDSLPFHSYRELEVPNTEFKIGDDVYVNSNKSYLGTIITHYVSREFNDVNDDGKLSCLLVSVLNKRTKAITSVFPNKLKKITCFSDLKKLIGVSNDNGSTITSITNKSISVTDSIGKVKGYRLTTMGGIYEALELLRIHGFAVSYINKDTKQIKNFEELIKFCNTLNCKLLLNNTEDKQRWQISDLNNIKFDFVSYLNEKGFHYN